jgi:hypothetical protein
MNNGVTSPSASMEVDEMSETAAIAQSVEADELSGEQHRSVFDQCVVDNTVGDVAPKI